MRGRWKLLEISEITQSFAKTDKFLRPSRLQLKNILKIFASRAIIERSNILVVRLLSSLDLTIEQRTLIQTP